MDPILLLVLGLFAIPAGLIYVITVYRLPQLGTLAGVFLLPMGPLASLPVTSGGIRMTWLVMFSVLGIYLARCIVRQETTELVESLVGRPLSILILLFTLLSFASIISSGGGKSDGAWYDIYRLGVGLAAYFLICFMARDKTRLRRVVLTLAAVSFLVASSGILEIVTKARFYDLVPWVSFHGQIADKFAEEQEYTMRTSGLAADAPFHNLDVVTFIAILLLVMISDRRRLTYMFAIPVMAMLVINLAGSGSRGAAGMFVLMMAVFSEVSQVRHRWLIAGLVLVLVVGTAAGMYFFIPDSINLERFFRTGGDSIETRIFNIEPALRMFASSPLLGVGPSRFVELYHFYASDEAPKEEVLRPHNTFLELLAERGLAGFSCYMAMQLLSMWILLQLYRKSPDFFLRTLGGVGFSWFCGYLFFSGTSNCTLRYTGWIMMGVASAAAYVNHHLTADDVETGPLTDGIGPSPGAGGVPAVPVRWSLDGAESSAES